MNDNKMDGFTKAMLAIFGMFIGVPVLGAVINNISDNRLERERLKNRQGRIRELQDKGANVNINLRGEV